MKIRIEKLAMTCPLCLMPNPKCRYYKAPLPYEQYDEMRHVFTGMDTRQIKIACMYYDTLLKDHVSIYAC
jgi:hypothetical protein